MTYLLVILYFLGGIEHFQRKSVTRIIRVGCENGDLYWQDRVKTGFKPEFCIGYSSLWFQLHNHLFHNQRITYFNVCFVLGRKDVMVNGGLSSFVHGISYAIQKKIWSWFAVI